MKSISAWLLVLVATGTGVAGCRGGGESSTPISDAPSIQTEPERPTPVGTTIPTGAPDFRGIITLVTPNEIRVEVDPSDEQGSPKAVIIFRRAGYTAGVIFRRAGPGEPEDLTVGQTVSVWFEGGVQESYPIRADAAVIVIEPTI